jgi:hypothetical protein
LIASIHHVPLVKNRSWKQWLGNQNYILVIDELNKISMDGHIAKFLKHNFLLPSGRGLVCSSHVVSLNGLLAGHMDGQGSGREIRTYPLPNIVCLPAGYLIRGIATQKDQSIRLWTTPSDINLENFFGKSASQWSPKAWKVLQ